MNIVPENLTGSNAVFSQTYTAGIYGKTPTRILYGLLSAATVGQYNSFTLVAYNPATNLYGNYIPYTTGTATWQNTLAGFIWDDDFTPGANVSVPVRIIYGDVSVVMNALNQASSSSTAGIPVTASTFAAMFPAGYTMNARLINGQIVYIP
jgi:hypothetical protein